MSGLGTRTAVPPPAAKDLLSGNEAIARGLLRAGCEIATGYPGTPSTEILEAMIRLRDAEGLDAYLEWSVNEKVALDIALAAAMMGKRAACTMKQVGLNVAADALTTAAYTGVEGALVLVVCDDPGPHSSQTEQDTRLFAHFAKIPVLDPSSPAEAAEMAIYACDLSERHKVPVILRPTTRVCHARAPVSLPPIARQNRTPKFEKDPSRWAATAYFRYRLHETANRRLDAIRNEFESSRWNRAEGAGAKLGIIASGVAYATLRDVLDDEGMAADVLKVGTPHPLPLSLVSSFVDAHDRVLVLEEPDAAIEMQLPDRRRVEGRGSGHVPPQGELTGEVVAAILRGDPAPVRSRPAFGPRLCPGCGHRAAFFAVKKALPTALVSGDIGCYTLGQNQGALDTCLDMGASITLATGFWQAQRRGGDDRPIVAAIGDSTFFHSGLPGLLNAVATGARFVVLVLDNGTIAMTGGQATPTGASIEAIARGIGVRHVVAVDPYDVGHTIEALQEAHAFTRVADGGVALVVARHPCVLSSGEVGRVVVDVVAEACRSCDYCLKFCECPGLVKDASTGKVSIDHSLCTDCGMCISMCPPGAIQEVRG